VSTADGTFAAEPVRDSRAVLRFGRIVVVGGGCYGRFYVRQLGRAATAGAVEWRSLVVVDRDPDCAVARLAPGERPPRLAIVTAEWRDYFAEFLAAAAGDPDPSGDSIVPSPLMPHLMADWLVARARERWAGRTVRTVPLAGSPAVPWQRAGEDGTHYVSFAEWMCPINCIEPARCPETRGERGWSMPVAVRQYVDAEREAGRTLEPALVFHCTHRVYGVGMIDVRDVVDADAAIATTAATRGARFVIGTVSHCHGALRVIEIAPRP
jgi:hypothetical protein